jgi:hypothetical protein
MTMPFNATGVPLSNPLKSAVPEIESVGVVRIGGDYVLSLILAEFAS